MALVDMKRPKPKKSDMKGMAMPVMAKVTSISSREAVREKEGSQVVELQIEKIGLDKKSAKFAGWANEQKKGPTE